MNTQNKHHIIEAQHQVRKAEMQVAQQEAIITLLEQDNFDATEPRRLLITFKATLALARKRLQHSFDRRS